MQQQIVVRVQQMLLRNAFQQRLFDAFDSRFMDEPRAVRDAEDMRVDRQCRHAVTDVHDDVCRLPADAWQRHQLFTRLRNFAVEIGQQFLADADDGFCFVAVKTDSFDGLRDAVFPQIDVVLAGLAFLPKLLGDDVDLLVRRLRGQDDGDEQVQHVAMVEFAAWRDMFGENVEKLFDLACREKFWFLVHGDLY